MPLHKPSIPTAELPATPVAAITDAPATTPVYSRKEAPGNRLINDIEGEPWTVEYYNQILTSTESPKILDMGLDPTIQQYLRVTGFRLSVTDDLTSSQESVTNTTIITGGGLIYPETIIPNTGDMFVGRVEAGVPIIFTVIEVERLTFYARSVYRVVYKVYADYTDEIVEDLTSKIAENRYFDNKRLILGKSPIVTYDVINREELYSKAIERNVERLYNDFWDDDSNTFIFDTDLGRCYDPWAVNFFNDVLGRAVRKRKPMPTEYEFGDTFKPIERPTIWRMIKQADAHGITYLYPRNFNLVRVEALDNPSPYHSIGHIRVSVLPIPDAWNTQSVDEELDAYVVSHNFYKDETTSQTAYEKAILMSIRGESVTNLTLDTLLTEIESETGSILFYRLLIITGLLRIKLAEH